MKENFIYLDNNSTTPVDPRVLEAMTPYFIQNYANAASSHRFGLNVKNAVERSRASVANLIKSDPEEIVFTSGATESINLAIKGTVNSKSGNHHIITVGTEHPAVLDTCKSLENQGHEVTYLKPNKEGLITTDDVLQAIQKNTALVSVMYANNETGVIQPIKQIAEACKKRGILFLTDATQAVGKIDVDVSQLGVDFLALSAHKFYGPKGIGALYIKKGAKPNEIISGGGHENGFRSGTLNTPGIIGLGKACEISLLESGEESTKIKTFRDHIEQDLLELEGAFINGTTELRLPNTTNICIPGVEANVLIGMLQRTMISNGSACSSAVIEASHVLKSMGLSDEQAFSSIRISLGRFTKEDDVQVALKEIRQTIDQIRV